MMMQHHQGGNLLETAGLGDEVADALARRDGLGEDQGDDGDAGGKTEAIEDRRQGEREDHLADQSPAAEPEGPGGLDDPAVDVADPVGGVQVHRGEAGQGDQQHLGCLADPEPDDEEEDQGGEGQSPEHLEGGVEDLLAQPEQAHDDPEDQAQPSSDEKAHDGAGRRNADVAEKVLVHQQVGEGVPRGGGRRQFGAADDAGAGQPPPQEKYGDGQDGAQGEGQRPAPPAGHLSTTGRMSPAGAGAAPGASRG